MNLVVQQEFGASFQEGLESGRVHVNDFVGRLSGLQSFKGCGIAEQAQVGVDIPGARVVPSELSSDREACCQRLEDLAVSNGEANSTAFLSGELAGVGRERHGSKGHAGQIQLGEIFCEQGTVEPGSTDMLERRSCPATDGKIRSLKQADARIQQRGSEAAHIGRWIDPGQARVVEELITMPATHFDNPQIEVELEFGLQQQSDLSDGHAVTNSDSVKTNKGLQSVVEYGTRDVDAVDGVRSIEYDEANAVVSCRSHRVAHGRNIGVETGANVLNIENESINAGEHCGTWPAHVSVKTNDRYSGTGLAAVSNNLDVEKAGQAVLGTEDTSEVDVIGFVQQLDAALSVGGNAGVICDQSDVAASQLTETVALQDVDTGENRRLSCDREKRDQQQKNFDFHTTATIEQCLWN